MKTSKVIVKIASQEQHENLKNARKTLKVLQESASDKENLAGRSLTIAGKIDPDNNQKQRKRLLNKAVQTGEATITEDDLMNDEPSLDYWKKLAETKSDALDRSLHENETLKDQITSLQEENRLCKEMIDESKHLIEVLQEMIQEGDVSTDVIAEEDGTTKETNS